jgi:hypothetical protein
MWKLRAFESCLQIFDAIWKALNSIKEKYFQKIQDFLSFLFDYKTWQHVSTEKNHNFCIFFILYTNFFWICCRNTQIINFIKTRCDFGMHESNRLFNGSFSWSSWRNVDLENPWKTLRWKFPWKSPNNSPS